MDTSFDRLTDAERSAGKPAPSGTSVASGNAGTSGPARRDQVPRRHVKVRVDLYERLRAGVWHGRTHGRPRLLLDDLVDEIVGEWYERAKTDNGGADLEDHGPLR